MTIRIFRSPAVLTALAAALLLGPGASLRAADDDTAARRESAEKLLDTLHMQQTVENASKRMYTSADQFAERLEKRPNATPEQIEDAKKLRTELRGLITQSLGWEAVKGDLVQAYADELTLADLKEVDAFYHTPAGLKFVDKQPVLADKFGALIQQRSKTLIPTLQAKLQAANAKVRPTPPPVPVTAPPAAGLPMPPVPAMTAPPVPPTVTTPPVSVTTAPVSAPTPVVEPSATPKP